MERFKKIRHLQKCFDKNFKLVKSKFKNIFKTKIHLVTVGFDTVQPVSLTKDNIPLQDADKSIHF